MSVIDWLYENDPEARLSFEDDRYDGLADPTRYKWDLSDGSGFSHSDECNGDYSDVSGRCETDPIE